MTETIKAPQVEVKLKPGSVFVFGFVPLCGGGGGGGF